MIDYTFYINGDPLGSQLIFASWQYGINQIPEMCIRLVNIDKKQKNKKLASLNVSKDKKLKLGNAIELLGEVKRAGKVVESAKFKGIVTGQCIGVDGHSYAEITAHGEAIKLTEGEITRVFKPDKHEDDTKVIKTLATSRNVKLDVPKPDTAIKQKQFFIYQQTPWRAIMCRALANGFLFLPSSEGDKIVAADDVEKASSSAIKVSFEKDGIEHITIEQDIRSQFDEIKLAGWDISKQAVTPDAVGKVTALDKYKELSYDSLKLKKIHNLTTPVDKDECKTRADAILFYQKLDLVQGKLVINMAAAPPEVIKLKPLDVLDLQEIGDSFSGKFLVSSVKHEISPNGWRAHIELGLHLNYTLLSDWWRPPAIPNLVGIVGKFADDPDKLHRLPVWLPGVCPDDKQLLFARLATPFASSDQSGSFFPPNEKDEVIVSFIGGDARFPVILGSMHNPVNAPPLKYAEKNEQVGFFWGKQKLGIHALLTEDTPALELIGGEKTTINLNDKEGIKAVSEKSSVSISEALELSHSDTAVVTIKDKDNVDITTGTLAVTVSQKMEVS